MTLPLWRKVQRSSFTRIEPLCDFLELSPFLKEKLLTTPKFPLNLPYRLAEKIKKNSLEDPILRQFVPTQEETVRKEGFLFDPVQDERFRKTKKILHKYQGRALILVSSACAMHCRFCFRQNFPYEVEDGGFDEELAYLASDSTISEVILSGGDPLSLSDERLMALFQGIEKIPHIKRIRFHSRFPIGIPERIDDSFLQILQSVKQQVFFMIHCNHPKELDADVLASLQRLIRIQVPVLSQSVLLKGVNDDFEVLISLFETLINAGVIPYYLHEMDPVEGGAHFTAEETKGQELIRGLLKKLPGYSVPRLVREEPGMPSKTVRM